MNLVAMIQSGDDGPVKIASTTDRGKRRLVESLQRGNPDLLHVREVFDGDERLERQMHVDLKDLHVARDWYQATVLLLVEDYPRWVKYDPDEESQRIAVAALDRLGRLDT